MKTKKPNRDIPRNLTPREIFTLEALKLIYKHHKEIYDEDKELFRQLAEKDAVFIADLLIHNLDNCEDDIRIDPARETRVNSHTN